jgi:hypothetical protein
VKGAHKVLCAGNVPGPRGCTPFLDASGRQSTSTWRHGACLQPGRQAWQSLKRPGGAFRHHGNRTQRAHRRRYRLPTGHDPVATSLQAASRLVGEVRCKPFGTHGMPDRAG